MLSQAEIDALLGSMGAEAAGPAAAPIAAPVDPTVEPSAPRGRPRTVRPYDFRRPDKFSKDQLRTLQALHENVARLIGGRLSARLRSTVGVSLGATAQLVFDEFLAGLELPTQLVVVEADGLDGPFLVELDLGLAFAAIDRLLGGPGAPPPQRREPTAIEDALIGRLIDDIVPAIGEGWSHLASLGVRVTEKALRPDLLRVAAPSAATAVLTFEVRLGSRSAPLSICYPHDSLAPILARLSPTAWYGQSARSEASLREALAAALAAVEVPVAAVLGGTTLSVEQLADLAPGDVIRFDQPADGPIALSVMDQARAWALPGRVRDRLAVRLVTPLVPLEA